MIDAIHRIMADDTAGDPISGLKWSRKTREKISRQLRRSGISVSPKTVGRLLKKLNFKLRVNTGITGQVGPGVFGVSEKRASKIRFGFEGTTAVANDFRKSK